MTEPAATSAQRVYHRDVARRLRARGLQLTIIKSGPLRGFVVRDHDGKFLDGPFKNAADADRCRAATRTRR